MFEKLTLPALSVVALTVLGFPFGFVTVRVTLAPPRGVPLWSVTWTVRYSVDLLVTVLEETVRETTSVAA